MHKLPTLPQGNALGHRHQNDQSPIGAAPSLSRPDGALASWNRKPRALPWAGLSSTVGPRRSAIAEVDDMLNDLLRQIERERTGAYQAPYVFSDATEGY